MLKEHQKHALHMAAMAQMASFELMVLMPYIAQDNQTAFMRSSLLGALVGAFYMRGHRWD
jgi:hypothetical protein